MFCARLPNSVFSQILDDIQTLGWQYGPLSKIDHVRERARFLSGYFNQIVALFSGLMFNNPEATKGRIEYQFNTYGVVTIVFIEVERVGSLTERLDYYAQVIAECDGKF
jgi:hypothetical protein